MTAPRRKPRWSTEKRTAKGLGPNRPRGKKAPGAPLNRKERRAAEFGEASKFQDVRYREREEGHSSQREERRGERPYAGGDRRNERSSEQGERRFDTRGPRRTERSSTRGGAPASGRDDRRSFDRGERRSFDGEDRRSRDERSFSRDTRRSFDRGAKSRPFDRDEQRRYDRTEPRFERERRSFDGDRPQRSFEDRGPRREDRGGGDRPFQERRRREHLDRDPGREHRGRLEGRRGRFEERPAEPETDQMSWTAGVAEEFTGDLTAGFLELGVAEPLVRVLAGQGITEPFPIQAATIGDANHGRDVLGRGRTGSGKTLAFGLPMLTRLAEGTSAGAPRSIVLTPTRELALQIADNLSPLASAVGLDLILVAGGMSYGPQIRAFERGVDVVVATPGRLIDLVEQGAADLSRVEISVLDEADHMADMGFLQEVRTILDATPEGGQRLLFSATLDDAVGSLVKRYLNDPATHEVDSSQASVTTMLHRPLLVKPHHKNQVTAEIANREGKTVLFARTQMGTDRIAAQLREAGVMAGALHGGLTQGARARILTAFREGSLPVLVATDVAARGIHVDDVTLVLQVDPPRDSKDYLHRAGRTARAGQEGIVATIMLPHQRKLGRRLLTQAGVHSTLMEVEPSTPELREATGARTPSDVPIDEAKYLALIAPKQQARRHPGPRGRRPRNRRW